MISVIIPCKDRSENTKKILDELMRQKKDVPAEIIVIENGSTEDMSFLNDFDITLRHEDIVGYGHAVNTGLSLCKGDYVCFIDNDDWISPDYLRTIYENIQSGMDWYVWQWTSDEMPVLMLDMDITDPLKKNWALWGYCFKRDLITKFKFDETKMAGSDLLIFDIITKETKGAFIKKVLYHFKWANNNDSLSHIYNSQKHN